MAGQLKAFFAMDSIISGLVYSIITNPPGNTPFIRLSNNSLNDWDGVPKIADLHPLLSQYLSQFNSKFIRLKFLSCTEIMPGDKSIKLIAELFKAKRFLIQKKYFQFLNLIPNGSVKEKRGCRSNWVSWWALLKINIALFFITG